MTDSRRHLSPVEQAVLDHALRRSVGVIEGDRPITYVHRGFIITHDPPPIGTRSCDWQAHRPGDEDAGSLTAPTMQALIAEIDTWYEERGE